MNKDSTRKVKKWNAWNKMQMTEEILMHYNYYTCLRASFPGQPG